jgi:HEAT repeat protein
VTETCDAGAELTRGLASPDEEIRRGAVLRMHGVPLAELLQVLSTILGDVSWRVRKEAVDLIAAAEPAPETVEELVRMLRAEENAGLRNSAVEALTRIGIPALPVLHRYVSDPDHDVRKFVIDTLGGIAHPSSVPMLSAALGDEDVNVRAAAAENLGKIGTEEVMPHLLAALSHPDLWLRFSILEALAAAGRPVPSATILPLASGELLRKAVFDCLAVVGDIEAAPVLLQGLREKSRKSREAAVRAVARLRGRGTAAERERIDSGLRDLRGSEVVEGILSLLDRSDLSTEEAALMLLGVIGDERSVPVLLHGCRDDRLRPYCINAFREIALSAPGPLFDSYEHGTFEERSLIIYLCGEVRFPGAETLLRRALHDSSPSVRGAAAVAAGKSGAASLVPDLLNLLDDREPEVREAAVEALARLAASDRETVLRGAVPLAASDSPEKRTTAAILFGALGDGEKLSLLVKDEASPVRRAAVAGLARLKQKESVGHLVMALVDEDPDVRVSATEALGEIGGEEVVAPLTLALRDEDPWLQCAALRGLGKQGDVALPAVSAVARSASGMVKIASFEALADIGGKDAFCIIASGLGDSDEDVVKTAVDLLRETDDDGWIGDYAVKLLSHPHWEVRSVFVRTIAEKSRRDLLPLLVEALPNEQDDLVRAQMQETADRFR